MKDNLKAGLLRNSIKSDRRLISDTEELILICAGLSHDENMLPRARELISGRIDWKLFKENALRSGLYLIIYNSLKKIDRESAVPKDILVLLKAAHLCAVSKTGIQYNETAHLLKLFFEKNIPIVPLKGPLLARRLYGDIAARGVSTDIDLLIEEKNTDKAKEILGLAGYAASSGEIWNIIGQQPFGKEDRSTIDLQWQINPVVPNNERMKGFWDGTRLRQEDGVSYHEFKEAELLLQLSVHFVDSSHLIQLKHICDIHELLTKFGGAMQWDGVIEKAFRWKLSGSLYAALLFSEKLFGPSVPDKVMKKIKPGPAKRILINILAQRGVILNKNSKRRRFIESFVKYILFQALEAKSLEDYFAIFFPPKEKMGSKTYADRMAGGVSKLKRAIGFKRS